VPGRPTASPPAGRPHNVPQPGADATFGLVIEYDGTGFSGSQLQARARTVQGELETALEKLFACHIRVKLASRTDSGVHATGQVAAFVAPKRLDEDTVRRALNFHLPEDLRVRCAQAVPHGFDPRRRARSREYVYTLNDAASPPAINRRTECHIRGRLDEGAMDAAARILTGTRNFAAFAGPATLKGAPTVRKVYSSNVRREGDRVLFTVRANAFLHQQMRRMGAALIDVGLGRMDISQFTSLVTDGARGQAKKVAKPQGLCLTNVEYGGNGPCGLPT